MAIKTIVIQAGECAVLPSNASVVAIVVNGSVSVSADCSLPAPEAYRCWRFIWGDVSGDAEYDDAYFTGVKIGDTTYNVLGAPASEVNTYDNGADFLAQVLPYTTPSGLVTGIVSGGGEAASPKCLAFKIPTSLGAPILFWEVPVGGGGIQYSSMIPVADICDCD